jgi:hypothetical protein
MLIRSQDKKILIPNELGYLVAAEEYGSGYSVFLNSGYLKETWWRLGEYSTEAKAIKVLDRIYDAYAMSNINFNIVFQMPQESEV